MLKIIISYIWIKIQLAIIVQLILLGNFKNCAGHIVYTKLKLHFVFFPTVRIVADTSQPQEFIHCNSINKPQPFVGKKSKNFKKTKVMKKLKHLKKNSIIKTKQRKTTDLNI